MTHRVPPSSTSFALVDVFSDRPLSGNPLAVIPDAAALDPRLFPGIAREFNQSETTFLLPPTQAGADWRLRSFTPAGNEVFGPGHNALGAWWWLAMAGRLHLPGVRTEFRQELGPRVLSLAIELSGEAANAIEMEQGAPEFGAIVTDRRALALALGLRSSDLLADALPPQVVSVGAPHLLVAVLPAALQALQPDSELLRALLLAAGGEGCYVYCLPEASAIDASARFFNPVAGIVEDPATGSAAGPLAAYLRRHERVAGPRVRIAQGAATGRPSELEVVMRGERVLLRGRAVVAAEGVLRLSTAA